MNENLNKNEWIDERMIGEQLNQMDQNNTEAIQYSLKHTGQGLQKDQESGTRQGFG